MVRITITGLIALFLINPLPAADKKLDIRWRGQSFFQIESSKGTRIVIDPHAIEAYNRNEGPVTADVLLISHEHDDHNQAEVVRVRDKKNIFHGLQKNKDNPRRLEWNAIDKSIEDVRVYSVGTYHDTSRGMERGLNTVFVLEIDGLRIVHLGDLGHLLTPQQIKQIGPVDILMIPVGGVYALNGSEAKQVVAQLKPRSFILPMHYGTKDFDDLLPPDEFLDEVPRERIKRLPGNKLTIDTDRKPPPEPTIVLMNWK